MLIELDEERLVQISADDESAAISGVDDEEVVRRAHVLVWALTRVPWEVGRTFSWTTRKNFPAQDQGGAMGLFKGGRRAKRWGRTNGRVRNTALLQRQGTGAIKGANRMQSLPFPTTGSLRLLRLKLDRM